MRPSESLNHELQGSVYIVWRGQKTERERCLSEISSPTDPWEIPLRASQQNTFINTHNKTPARPLTCTYALQSSMASRRTSMLRSLSRCIFCTALTMYPTTCSATVTSEPEVTPEWGPLQTNRFGKPSTASDRYASGTPAVAAQRSLSACPPRPRTRNGYWKVVSKPVAQTRTSSSCVRPSRSSTPVGMTCAISVVSSVA